MEDKIQNSISTDELYKEYDWYQRVFPEIVQSTCDDFFADNFETQFIGLSKNINCLMDSDSCFVTKIRINQDYDMFFRTTEKAIAIILNTTLGQSKSKFNINKISELEAKIITSFNSYLFDALKDKINEPPASELRRSNFDVIHMTFIIKDKENYTKNAGKIIITIPQSLITPEAIQSSGEKFSEDDFPDSETSVKVLVGKTRFSLFDVKNLEEDDVVVFDDSSLEQMKLSAFGEEMEINLEPNMDILIPETNDGGDDMGDGTQKNIWDSIEVDMYAEFDSVKVTLGELKDIENGLVVDLTSLYNNNVTLKVEGKPIASGTLVIVNDRYGVKVNQILTGDGVQTGPAKPSQNDEEYSQEDEEQEDYSNENEVEENNSQNDEEGEEDFDYSDFELEDENI